MGTTSSDENAITVLVAYSELDGGVLTSHITRFRRMTELAKRPDNADKKVPTKVNIMLMTPFALEESTIDLGHGISVIAWSDDFLECVDWKNVPMFDMVILVARHPVLALYKSALEHVLQHCKPECIVDYNFASMANVPVDSESTKVIYEIENMYQRLVDERDAIKSKKMDYSTLSKEDRELVMLDLADNAAHLKRFEDMTYLSANGHRKFLPHEKAIKILNDVHLDTDTARGPCN